MTDASCQRLGDALLECKLVGTSQDELSHSSVAVENALQPGKKGRDALNFIQNRAVGELSEKSPRVFGSQQPMVWVFQADVRFVGKSGPGECGFAGLPRAGKSDGWIPVSQIEESFQPDSNDHLKIIASSG